MMCIVFSVQIYIYTLRRNGKKTRKRGERNFSVNKSNTVEKKTFKDIYKTLYFHEMSKCDIGYT